MCHVKRTILLTLNIAAATHAGVAIQPVAVSTAGGRDAVPGRPAPYVFWGESDTLPPAINNAGEVVFRAKSASVSNVNSGAAFGIYVKRPGEPLAVLMDTTLDTSGNPSFSVPGQPGDTAFISSLLGAPLINNSGDVVFFARFSGPTSGSGEGFYTVKTTGGPIGKIVDTSDPVPGHATGTFLNYRFTSNTLARMAVSLNDAGQVVYWAQFCLEASCTSATQKNGIFGTGVSGGSGILLADSTRKVCPTGIPFGLTCDPNLDQGFWEIRPEKGIASSGDVIFHGKIRKSGSSTCCGGVFTVPVTGGTIATVAYRSQPAPPSGAQSYSDRFDEVAHNATGTALFLPRLGTSSPARFGVYSADLAGSAQARIADTVPGTGPAVPGVPADGEFTSLAMPTFNDAGHVGFRATSNNSVESNNDGIYATDASGGPIRLVLDKLSQAPGLPAPARVTSFQEATGVAMNAEGHMAFAGLGLDHLGSLFYGIYFYDSCSEQVSRIADSTTALADLGAMFGSSGSREFEVFTQGEARAGQYRSLNDNNQVAFTAQFSNFDFGIYIADITGVGGGSLSIECPADASLACGDDTSPAAIGKATADGCGSITIDHSDTAVAGCAGTQTITRTWSASVGSGAPATCQQIIIVSDGDSPVVTLPTDAALECDSDTSPTATGSATATDDCDGSPVVTSTDSVAGGTCAGDSVITRTWTATDDCGNSSSGDQVITLSDTIAPAITAPPDVSISCDDSIDPSSTGQASSTDNCDAAPLVTHSDSVVAGACATESVITRTWTATDSCGNADSVEQTITVVDAAPPSITAPADISVECDAVPTPAAPTAIDACEGAPVVTFAESRVDGICPNDYALHRTWTATDACGNSAGATQVVTVTDSNGPVVSGIPGDLSVECDAVPAPAAPTANDACDGATGVILGESQTPGACDGDYTLTRTWSSTDACGNSSGASQVLSVVDTMAPTINCPPDATGLECPADTTIAANGSAGAGDNCSAVTIGSSDATATTCGNAEAITRTWSATDDCGNESSCAQAIQTVDTTPPSLTVDTTPIHLLDSDCSGDEPATLPSGSAHDDCDGSVGVSNDAPASFPAGETTTVTFSATDACGNSASAQSEVSVEHGATIKVRIRKFVVGWGNHPGVSKQLIEGALVGAYDKSPGSCAQTQIDDNWGVVWWAIPDIVANCQPVNAATTHSDGIALIDVPPGDYVVATHFDSDDDGDLDQYLGRKANNVDCGETHLTRLFMIRLANGRRLGCKWFRYSGSELLVIEPEEVVWDGTEQLYPFVFDSDGDWDVAVSVAPPEGFVADHDQLTENVDNELESVQFTITEVGSDLVPTKTAFRIRHKGTVHKLRSKVGIALTPDYARSRGFDVKQLRNQGLIVSDVHEVRRMRPVRSTR